jgi:hypothetical protein
LTPPNAVAVGAGIWAFPSVPVVMLDAFVASTVAERANPEPPVAVQVRDKTPEFDVVPEQSPPAVRSCKIWLKVLAKALPP